MALVAQCGGLVPCLGLFPRTVLLSDLSVDHLPARRRPRRAALPRLLPVERYLEYISNRALPDPTLRGVLEGLVERVGDPRHRQHVAERLTAALAGLDLPEEIGELVGAALVGCASCGIDLPHALAELAAKAFMIVIQDFQDPYTLNVKQLMKCCVEEITPDGRLIPFCAYNSVGYREQVREQLSGSPGAGRGPQRSRARRPSCPTRHGSRTGDPWRAHRRSAPGQPRPEASMSGMFASLASLGRVTDLLAEGGPPAAETVKACCAAAYGVDLVGLFLGDSYHPGGADLTRRLAEVLSLGPGERVLDVACGIGTTAMLLAGERQVDVVGVDLGEAQVRRGSRPCQGGGDRRPARVPGRGRRGAAVQRWDVRRRCMRVCVLHLSRQGRRRRRAGPRRACRRPCRHH